MRTKGRESRCCSYLDNTSYAAPIIRSTGPPLNTTNKCIASIFHIYHHPTSAFGPSFLANTLLLVPLHSQNLHHPDENVDKVEFKADALIHGIPLDDTSLRQSRVVEDFLDIVERKTAKDG